MLVEFTPGAWLATDFMLASLCMAFAYFISPLAYQISTNTAHLPAGGGILLYGLFFVISSHILGMHDRSVQRGESQLVTKALLTTLLAAVLYAAAGSLLFFQTTGRYIVVLASMSIFAATLLSRSVVWRLSRNHAERICLLGDETFLDEGRQFLLNQERPVEITLVNLGDVLHADEKFVAWGKEVYLDEIVCMNDPSPLLGRTLMKCMNKGIRVSNYVDHLERYYGCVPINRLDHRWFLRMDMQALHPQYVALKRATDVIVASLGLLLAAPFLALSALAIKLESPGPVFYKQTRVGLRNKNFSIFKLRSMRNDAERGGAQWAQKGDARVTRIGKFLRLSRLDEVPQFLNIIKGDMSFIGPRPERPEFVDSLAEQIPYYRERHLLKPGLTGWAQIHADYGGTVEGVKEKLKYDLFYVKHASLQFDLHILIRTIGAMMKGAR
jgi:exopolysaccharide biosynthesis polyprenyl glycosylphosphotransferase